MLCSLGCRTVHRTDSQSTGMRLRCLTGKKNAIGLYLVYACNWRPSAAAACKRGTWNELARDRGYGGGDSGDGEPVICIHGLGGTSTPFSRRCRRSPDAASFDPILQDPDAPISSIARPSISPALPPSRRRCSGRTSSTSRTRRKRCGRSQTICFAPSEQVCCGPACRRPFRSHTPLMRTASSRAGAARVRRPASVAVQGPLRSPLANTAAATLLARESPAFVLMTLHSLHPRWRAKIIPHAAVWRCWVPAAILVGTVGVPTAPACSGGWLHKDQHLIRHRVLRRA